MIGEVGIPLQSPSEVIPTEQEQVAVIDGSDRGVARRSVQQRHLPEKIAGLQRGDHFVCGRQDFDGAVLDDVQGVGRIAGAKQDFTWQRYPWLERKDDFLHRPPFGSLEKGHPVDERGVERQDDFGPEGRGQGR